MNKQNKIYFRSLILNYYKQNLTAIKIFNILKLDYKENSPSYAFVKKWRSRFVLGIYNLEDSPKSGRPKMHEEGKYNDLILKLIKIDPSVSLNELAKCLGFSKTKTGNYIKNNLGLKKKMCKWVPHLLTKPQKKKRLDFCKNFIKKFSMKSEKNIYNIITGDESWLRFWDPKVGNNAKIWQSKKSNVFETCIKNIKDEKLMISIFFSKTGIVSLNILNKKFKANSKWYRDIFLNNAFIEWKNSHKKQGINKILLHHDNAPIHTSKMVTNFLYQNQVKTLKHPPYSPDLSPCDFWLFPTIKQRMRGTLNVSREEIILKF